VPATDTLTPLFSPRAKARATLSQQRIRVERVRLLLERHLGIPRQDGGRAAPVDTLIATMLSQNTNDRNSHQAYLELRRRFPRWSQVAEAPHRSITAAIRKGGMAHQKAPRIREALRTLQRRFGGYDFREFTRMSNEEIVSELTQLEGVGIKTASCVLLFSLGRDVFPVDTHIHRLCGRLGLVSGCRTPEQTFEAMAPLVRKGKEYSFHTNLIRFGRRVCKARNPLCGGCPLFAECLDPAKQVRRRARRGVEGRASDFMLLDNLNR
jgi:endonuclease-3